MWRGSDRPALALTGSCGLAAHFTQQRACPGTTSGPPDAELVDPRGRASKAARVRARRIPGSTTRGCRCGSRATLGFLRDFGAALNALREAEVSLQLGPLRRAPRMTAAIGRKPPGFPCSANVSGSSCAYGMRGAAEALTLPLRLTQGLSSWADRSGAADAQLRGMTWM